MFPDNMSVDHLIHKLQTDPQKGLSTYVVQTRIQKYGQNERRRTPKKTNVQKQLLLLKDGVVLMLLIAAVLSFATVSPEENTVRLLEPLMIFIVAILIVFLGLLIQKKAQKTLDALQVSSTTQARVIRNGKKKNVDAKELVPGDIMILKAGGYIAADARLIESKGFKTDECILTGNATPRLKDAKVLVNENASWEDRLNMVFSGCNVVSGIAIAVVTATGQQTEVEKAADFLERATEIQTPLQLRQVQTGKYVGIIILLTWLSIAVMGILTPIPIKEILTALVTLAVSAIPVGMSIAVSIVLLTTFHQTPSIKPLKNLLLTVRSNRRGVYQNTEKMLIYLFTTNIGGILTVLIAMLLWQRLPLLPLQLLVINLVTVSLPAVALSTEAVNDFKMEQTGKSMGTKERIISALLQGFMFALLTLLGYCLGEIATGQPDAGRTMAFIILALTQIVHSFNLRSNASLFQMGPFTNKSFNGAALISIAFIALIVVTASAANGFGLILLPGIMYLEAACIAIVPFFVMEIIKSWS